MRIGLINQLHGRPGGERPAPTWETLAARAEAAEAAGFDVFVFEDALLYRGEDASHGVWESTSIAAALAAVTSRVTLGPSVLNSPYRSPALVAKIAETIDEISGGRFVLGMGAGNTDDYAAFGFPGDLRYSRFAEAIQIVHGLLKDGEVDFQGTYYSAARPEMVLRGPRPQGPPINIAAGSPKMLRLAARYGDQWNWWAGGETLEETRERIGPILRRLDEACEAEDRDPADLERTLDLYTVVPDGLGAPDDLPMANPITGPAQQVAERLLEIGELGFSEIRCDVWPRSTESITAMSEVVDIVHS